MDEKVGTAIGKVAEYASTPHEAELQSITTAWASRDESLLSPPAIALQLADGRAYEFGILKSKMSPNVAHANRQHRDEMLAAIQRSLAG